MVYKSNKSLSLDLSYPYFTDTEVAKIKKIDSIEIKRQQVFSGSRVMFTDNKKIAVKKNCVSAVMDLMQWLETWTEVIYYNYPFIATSLVSFSDTTTSKHNSSVLSFFRPQNAFQRGSKDGHKRDRVPKEIKHFVHTLYRSLLNWKNKTRIYINQGKVVPVFVEWCNWQNRKQIQQSQVHYHGMLSQDDEIYFVPFSPSYKNGPIHMGALYLSL